MQADSHADRRSLPAVAREVAAWRARALVIPDAPTRLDALDSLARKRPNIDGAALFWIVPRRRSPELLRLLAAYQVIWDFLDGVSERGAPAGIANGELLHAALVAALDTSGPTTDHYALHPWRDDGGYLHSLISACREMCAALPRYTSVRTPILAAAARCAVQPRNHLESSEDRRRALQSWAAEHFPDVPAPWFEITAAASASVVPYALLTLAADAPRGILEIGRTVRAYDSTSLAIAMLDSYADQAEDETSGDHSYIAHYETPELAVERIAEIVRRTVQSARQLARGERHAVIACCMVAMYMSKDSTRTPTTSADTLRLIQSGGSLARLLAPVLRFWRACHALRAA